MKNLYNKEIVPRKWQIEAVKAFCLKRNLIVVAPTGSGKTTMTYGILEQEIDNHGKWCYKHIVFTAPTKSLSNERYKELKGKYADMVGIITGDIHLNEEARIICCTQEILLKKSFENSLIIIDEGQYPFYDEGRAGAYFEYLNNKESKNNDHLILSATISDKGIRAIQKIASFDLDVFIEQERLVEQTFIQEKLSPKDLFSYGPTLIFAFSYKDVEFVAKTMAAYKNTTVDEKVIIKYANDFEVNNFFLLNLIKNGVAVHHGKLLAKEKLMVEEMSRQGIIKILVATDGLAMGITLPYRTVAFTGFERKNHSGVISSGLFRQMAGRAGRFGLFEHGYVGVCDFGIASDDHRLMSNYRNLQNAELKEPPMAMGLNIERLISNASCGNNTIFLPKHLVNKEIEYLKKVFPGQHVANLKKSINNVFLNLNNFAKNEKIPLAKFLDLCKKYYFDEFDFYENLEYVSIFYHGRPKNLLRAVFDMSLEDIKKPNGLDMKKLLQIRKYLILKTGESKVIKEIEDFINLHDKNYLTAG